ncbi:MAG: putative metallophosphoesterase YhaO [Firmicutes bacterium ADurb.Bin193]|nr:MAG: putative metallophosphoesterase YhaO [Firmicutes bacterium ADurb.Bin193]
MNKIKILHAADFHIGAPLINIGKLSDIRRAELVDTFGKVIRLAKDEKVDALLLCGDIFDSALPSQTAVDSVCAYLNTIPEIKVFITLGNHDAGLKAQFPSNVHVFGRLIEKIECDLFDVYGASSDEENTIPVIPEGFSVHNPSKINILCLHADLVGSGQTSRYNPVTPDMLAKTGADYVALGHIHAYSGIKTAGTVSYAYPGIPEARGFDELGEKGVILGVIYKNHTELEFVRVCKRECVEISVDVTGLAGYNELCSKISEFAKDKKNLYKINLTGQTDEGILLDTSFISERLKDDYFYVKVNDFTTMKINIDALSQEYSLRGLFVKKVIEKGGSDIVLKYGLCAVAGEKVTVD